jgi:hypothetical protein
MSHITTVTHRDSRGSGGAPASPDKPPASRRRLRHIGAMLAHPFSALHTWPLSVSHLVPYATRAFVSPGYVTTSSRVQ